MIEHCSSAETPWLFLENQNVYQSPKPPSRQCDMALPAPRSQALRDATLDHLEDEKQTLIGLRGILENHLEKDQERGRD